MEEIGSRSMMPTQIRDASRKAVDRASAECRSADGRDIAGGCLRPSCRPLLFPENAACIELDPRFFDPLTLRFSAQAFASRFLESCGTIRIRRRVVSRGDHARSDQAMIVERTDAPGRDYVFLGPPFRLSGFRMCSHRLMVLLLSARRARGRTIFLHSRIGRRGRSVQRYSSWA